MSGAARLSAQVIYVEDVPLPEGHSDIVRNVTAPLDPSLPYFDPTFETNLTYMVTTEGIYYYTADYATQTVNVINVIPLDSEIAAYPGTIGEYANREVNDPTGNVYNLTNDPLEFLTDPRNTLVTYGYPERSPLNTQIVDQLDLPESPPDITESPQALISGDGQILFASQNQIWSSPFAAGSGTNFANVTTSPNPFTEIFGGTGTGNTQFLNVTGMAIGPGLDGLLYVLDWGAQEVKVYNLNAANGDYYVTSFAVPAGLLASNPSGQGFAIDDEGHMFIADGKGGAVELDLDGNVIGIADPPVGQTLGINASASDASYINFDGAGDVFVEDGANGLHWYYDTPATAPEPSTWALLGLAGAALLMARYRSLRVKAS